MPEKPCTKCGETKPLDAFSRRTRNRDGRHSWCRACVRAYYLAHKEEQAVRTRRWYERHKDTAVYQAIDRHLRHKYGTSIAEYEAMAAAQGGVCAICGKPEQIKRRLSVDHDHRTGAIRALLCSGCNTAIGHFGDDPDTMRRAADYVERHGLRVANG